MLELRLIGLAEGVAKREGDEERPRWLDFHGMLTHQGKTDGAKTSGLEDACQHTDRVRTQGSGGSEEHHLHAFVLQTLRHLRTCLLDQTVWVAQGAHKGVILLP